MNFATKVEQIDKDRENKKQTSFSPGYFWVQITCAHPYHLLLIYPAIPTLNQAIRRREVRRLQNLIRSPGIRRFPFFDYKSGSWFDEDHRTMRQSFRFNHLIKLKNSDDVDDVGLEEAV